MDYSHKYKKYKLKYLNLKSIMIGGENVNTISPRPSKEPSDMLSDLMTKNGTLDEKAFTAYIKNYLKNAINTKDYLKSSDIVFYIPLISAFNKYNKDPTMAKEYDDLINRFLAFLSLHGKEIADDKLLAYYKDVITNIKPGEIYIYPKPSSQKQPQPISVPNKPLPTPPTQQLPAVVQTSWKSATVSPGLSRQQMSTQQPAQPSTIVPTQQSTQQTTQQSIWKSATVSPGLSR